MRLSVRVKGMKARNLNGRTRKAHKYLLQHALHSFELSFSVSKSLLNRAPTGSTIRNSTRERRKCSWKVY